MSKITESQHLVIDIKNKLDRILYLERNKTKSALEGNPPKVKKFKVGDSILVAHNVLDDIQRSIK